MRVGKPSLLAAGLWFSLFLRIQGESMRQAFSGLSAPLSQARQPSNPGRAPLSVPKLKKISILISVQVYL